MNDENKINQNNKIVKFFKNICSCPLAALLQLLIL